MEKKCEKGKQAGRQTGKQNKVKSDSCRRGEEKAAPELKLPRIQIIITLQPSSGDCGGGFALICSNNSNSNRAIVKRREIQRSCRRHRHKGHKMVLSAFCANDVFKFQEIEKREIKIKIKFCQTELLLLMLLLHLTEHCCYLYELWQSSPHSSLHNLSVQFSDKADTEHCLCNLSVFWRCTGREREPALKNARQMEKFVQATPR